MKWLKRIGLWAKKNWKWLVGSFAILFSILAMSVFGNDIKRVLIQKKKVSLAKNKRDIAVLTEKRELIRIKIDHTEDQIKSVDDHIEYIEKDIEKDRNEILSLEMDEKLEKFDDFGY